MAKKQAAAEKVVFSYDRETKEFVGEYQCQPDPLEKGKFLIPADATEIPPPETLLFQKAVFDNGKWKVVPDYRGRKVVFLESQEIQEIQEFGELPDGAVLLSIDDEHELNQGKRARMDEDGNLEFYTPPPTTGQQIAEKERELTTQPLTSPSSPFSPQTIQIIKNSLPLQRRFPLPRTKRAHSTSAVRSDCRRYIPKPRPTHGTAP